MVTLDLFERVMNHAMSAEEAGERDNASTAHLKADKPRRPARCGTLVEAAVLHRTCSRAPAARHANRARVMLHDDSDDEEELRCAAYRCPLPAARTR
jgi:hypothetical protein